LNILDHLEGVRPNGREKYMARCPAHADRSPSLSIWLKDDGRILLKCFAGCDTEAVLTAMGLTFRDVMPERVGEFSRERPAFTASDALRALARESGIVAMSAARVQNGHPLTPEDVSRLCVATGRITAALEYVHGR
jgi:hypothetical protein